MQEADNKDNPEALKVMLADDDKDDQQFFQEALDQTNIPSDFTTVSNGQELMDKLKDESVPNPDILFIDMNMPMKNGKECLEEIKADENLKDIPTVIYSTSGNEKDVKESFEAGASVYLQKPVFFKNLIHFLRNIISLKWAGALLKPIWTNFFLSEKKLPDNQAKN